MNPPRHDRLKSLLGLPYVVLLLLIGHGVFPLELSAQETPRLHYVTTARQDGPVGYRDPLGVMSPDGGWLAYAAGTKLTLQHTVGGPVTELGPGINRITDLAWLPDSRHLAARERVFDRSASHWLVYDVVTGERTLLWPDKTHLFGLDQSAGGVWGIDTGKLQQLAWSPDGDSVAGIVRYAEGFQLWILGSDGGHGRVRASDKRLTYPAWIAFHTHADGTDDIWLQPADGSRPGRPISEGGVETGWPRWSPDGRWVAYTSEALRGAARHGALYLVGIDQETGEITMPQREVPLDVVLGGLAVVEWSPDSEQLVFMSVTEPGRKAIYVVGRDGGTPRKIHEFACDQLYSGLSVSPDFQWVAFIAPAPDGYFQVFRVPVTGGEAEQLTFDPTDKTHPSYAPDGGRIAFTVFSYQAHFWVLGD